MAMKQYRRIQADPAVDPTDEFNRMQDGIEEVLGPILSSEILDGRMIGPVIMEAGVPREINHRLGRDLVGWTVMRKNAAGDVFELSAGPLKLILQSPAAVTISLWVY